MLKSKCEVCDSEKSKFIREQEASRLLRSLGIKKPLSKIPLVGPLLFYRYSQVNTRYKMNEIVDKFLLAGVKFMSEMHLKQPGFTYSPCRPFTKNIERVQNMNVCMYQNELDKAYFQHDMAYGDFIDLTRRTASDKAFNIAKNWKYDGFQFELIPVVYELFDNKMSGSGIKNENISNKE